ncbi:hypothetical protein TNCV_2690891 [Trichonephila clavipes]|uniref:Uncharacterized protein n=1 Tax=Trichonephila clavipes TaxID=2585209 RepID=A0A8X6VYN5_TRICX|nr:hypothetical protein TNCV_2690891 [Trichonephila clavipes]
MKFLQKLLMSDSKLHEGCSFDLKMLEPSQVTQLFEKAYVRALDIHRNELASTDFSTAGLSAGNKKERKRKRSLHEIAAMITVKQIENASYKRIVESEF